MFIGFINTKISNKQMLLPLATFLSYFTNLSLFWIKMYPRQFFGEKRKPQSSSPLQSRGDPAMINRNYLF